MTKAPSRETRIHSIASCTQKTLLPLFAVGGSLAAAPGNALELGDAVVQSRLGQPLRASIAFALAPNETLASSCVSLSQGLSPSGLPGVGRATISIVDGALLLQGSKPIREPMVSANIVVKCQSTANLSREYTMFIDPPGIENVAPEVAPVAQAESAVMESRQVVATPTPQVQSTAPRRSTPNRNRTPVDQSARYQVQPGDSLSEITQRIENRSMPLWPAVNLIFEANPDAFIDNDPNKLKAGSWLTIPSFDGSEPVVASTPGEASVPAVAAVPAEAAIAPADLPTASEPVATQEPTDSAVGDPLNPVADFTSDLQALDAGTATDNSVVITAENETVSIPDVELEGPQTNSASPNVTTAAIGTVTTDEPSSSWMVWLAGLGVAVILALLLFGRSLRDRFTRDRFAVDTELPMPLEMPTSKPDLESSGIEVIERVDWDLGDESPTVENHTLGVDADLVMGTGLGESVGTNSINEVGFPAPTELDIELPEEPEVLDEFSETDVRPSSESGRYTVTVESEQLTDDDEFVLSEIGETVEMPRPDDDAQSEQETIDVETIDENLVLNDDTVDPSIAFEILERDYEDELTATQALDKEIARAALDLTAVTKSMSEKIEHFTLDNDKTAAMPMESISELEIVAPEDENAAANDDATIEHSLDEPTAEMPSVDDDKTELMSRKQRNVDSKAG